MRRLLLSGDEFRREIGLPNDKAYLFRQMHSRGYLYALVLPSGQVFKYPAMYAADLKKFLNGRVPSFELVREFNKNHGKGYAKKLAQEFGKALRSAGNPHLTAKQVKELLGVSEQVLQNWQEKDLVASTMEGRTRVYKPGDIAKACSTRPAKLR